MAGGQMQKIWDKLLSPFKQMDKRQLQHEIDIHRLFLLTSYNRLGDSGGEEAVEQIQSLARSTSFATQQTEVQSNVHRQIAAMADVLDNALLKASRPKPDEQRKVWQSGLSFAIGGAVPQPRAEIPDTWPLSRPQLSAIFRQHVGFTLECKRSGIEHQEAGDGLFLCGRAEPGTVVSMYPGIIYSPSQYRYMPQYPRVDRGNPYLISRYDGLVIDGKPWGRGGDTREWWDGTNASDDGEPYPQDSNLGEDTNYPGENAKRLPDVWNSIAGSQSQEIPLARAILERRNSLAFGHFANHPPKDVKPNVLICPYSATDEAIRPYIPNVVLGTEEQEMERRGLLWFREGRRSDDDDLQNGKRLRNKIRTLVLVAARALEDEELLLNYRLSSHIRTPSWFHPVDEAEDERRWE